MHPAELDDESLLATCEVRHVKRGGPGGQHRNKRQSGVVLRHRPSGILAEANERRDQAQNLAEALFRLRIELAIAIRTARTVRSPLWERRCRGGRLHISADHADFPALLAEALDRLSAASFEIPLAAQQLACTPTQLLKLLARQPQALAWTNGQRRDRGLPALRPGV